MGFCSLPSEKLGQGFVPSGCDVPTYSHFYQSYMPAAPPPSSLHWSQSRVYRCFAGFQPFLGNKTPVQAPHVFQRSFTTYGVVGGEKPTHPTRNAPESTRLLRQQHGCLGRLVSQVCFVELKISFLKENKVYIQQRCEEENGEEMNSQQKRRRALFPDRPLKQQEGRGSAAEKEKGLRN